ncbi:hypothetical protein BGZ63DRAFT_364040 [Mariannaea sp. PMI_226]|nr:hypothetical protein BGZ63DRAFT_364040 [Mariannaea sp. PMI_226]
MEQLGCTPCNPSASASTPPIHRDTEATLDESLSLSDSTVNVTNDQHDTTTTQSETSTSGFTPTTPTPTPATSSTSTQRPLSSSEPTLRFPRPQGNRHLANWISSSDPDIMRVTPTNDVGLSESTYELITGTDTESQDGNDAESMSESVGSLDFHRPDDDVNSLAGTEQTFDDESVVDTFEPIANPVDTVLQEDATDTMTLKESTQSQTTTILAGTPDPDTDSDADYESEDDAGSRSSLDYTQQSLGTPSIPTPEASKIVDRPSDTADPISIPTNAQLVPLENVQKDDWYWGGKKPDLAVFKQQHSQFLIRIPPKVKEAWLSKKCLSFSATRSLRTVPIDVSIAEDGMLIKFPQQECNGDVQVEILAQCRPKIRQVFRITFEKGIMKEALERTKNFAQNLTELVPAAAQEAERCIEEARRSFESASDNVLTASDSLLKSLATRFHRAHRSLYPIKAGVKERIHKTTDHLSKRIDTVRGKLSQNLVHAQDAQDQAKLSLLNAQISAKLWWLKMRNKTEHDRYFNKAKEFLAEKRAEANLSFMSRHPTQNEMKFGPSRFWEKLFTKPQCNCNNNNKRTRGSMGFQQCNFVG